MNDQQKQTYHESLSALFAVALIALVVLCLPRLLIAGTTKTGGDYEMSNDTLDAAGRIGVEGGTYVMMYSLGQPLGFATMTSTNYDLEGGYLSGVVSYITLAATATVTAPPGYTGNVTDPVPGAKVHYVISYQNYGEAAQTGGTLIENVFASATQYATASIMLNGVAKGDSATDGDECRYDTSVASRVVCTVTDVPAGATGAMEFEAIIQ